MKKITLFIILFWLISLDGLAQKPRKVSLSHTENYEITSKANLKKYTINVILPSNYNKKDSVKYPVLCVLDGNHATDLFHAISKNYELSKETKDVIIVAIDNLVATHTDWLAARHYDLTPSHDPMADAGIANYFKIPTDKMKSGGANMFLVTLKEQIIPFVEKKFKTNTERAIFGHSLGGLFAGYCLLNEPDLFQKYSLNSPSFWWKNSEIVEIFKTTKPISDKIELFVSAGQPEGDFMIKPIKAAMEYLKEKNANLKCTEKIFEDESHISVATLAASKSYKIFYAR